MSNPASEAGGVISIKTVDKVAVASKHPGVFMETAELEAETGQKLYYPPEPTVVKGETPFLTVSAPSAKARRKKTAKRSATKRKPKRRPLSEKSEKDSGEPVGDGLLEETENSEHALPKDKLINYEKALLEVSDKVSEFDEGSPKTSPKNLPKHDSKTGLPYHPQDIEAKLQEKDSPERLATNETQCGNEIEVASTVEKPENLEIAVLPVLDTRKNEDDEVKDDDAKSETLSVVRRSKRREQLLQIKAEKEAAEAAQHDVDCEYESSEDVDMEDSVSAERFDLESVGSELGSLESGVGSVHGELRMDSLSSMKKGQMSKAHKKSSKTKGKTKLPSPSSIILKGKSRRAVFKKSSTKAPVSVAKAVTSDRIVYKGQYFTKGDIVSVLDLDGGVYYAQLKGFLCDQYCEKSGVITWLLPTIYSSPPERCFDPATYVIGPEEELPRKLEHFTFVMHAPDDYFHYKNAPYPTKSIISDQEYFLTRLGPKIRLIKGGKPIYS